MEFEEEEPNPFLDELPVAQAAPDEPIVPVRYQTAIEERDAEVRAITDEIFSQCQQTLTGALRFADMPFDAQGPLPEWIEQYGEKEAERLFRLAKSGQLSSNQAPAGLKLAAQVALGIMKARATEKGGSKTLNMVVVEIGSNLNPREYPEEEWVDPRDR